ncbi:hypothetical protein PpBr36_03912 [Pyricularia pennisetigena]|uniref:hypothetical protein n=1 Tax=Pyricularia pennisetigena TaxID=1578925 RepID=UPI00114FA6D7|nr:hypothetical protein PpBr36_03912 [Pyricularia pennisetigena]TLS30743.1 hypothetical protein PpBr36_03912 [Pyricularia pennisetigena]
MDSLPAFVVGDSGHSLLVSLPALFSLQVIADTMVNTRSLFSLSLLASAALGNVLGGEEQSGCPPEKQVVRYVVVEMPDQKAPVEELPEEVVRGGVDTPVNTTTTLPPCKAPDVDTSDKNNIIPAPQVSLFYGDDGSRPTPPPFANSTAGHNTTVPAPQGSINMTLTTNHSFVALEYIDSITKVKCSKNLLTVKFSDVEAFDIAAKNWESLEAGLIIVTNGQGNCNDEFERGFFKVDDVKPNKDDLSIACTASSQKIEQVAGTCEMTFSSLPAATLRKRITLNPSTTLSFGTALAKNKTLLDLDPYLEIIADHASFESAVTFSGKLNYDFWAFKLKELYFDLDASFKADVALSASIQAAYSQNFQYAPDELEYTLINVPGVVALGPGVAFGIGVNLSASGAVDVHTALGVAMPKGNVHLDLVNKDRGTSATGWDPKYTAAANISQKAEVGADVYASVTVSLAVKVLGGLVDLSSGLTAEPRVNNRFSLAGNQQLSVGGSATTKPVGSVLQPVTGQGSCEQGVGIKSDFVFKLKGFITKYWSRDLFGVEVPIANQCYKFTKQ